MIVTITYGYKNGYLNDCNAEGTLNDQGADGAQEIIWGDVLRIYGKADNAADEYAEVQYNFTDISPLTYTHYAVRWRTDSYAAPGMGANAILNFAGGAAGTQFLVGTQASPAFSSLWTVNAGTIDSTQGDTIDELVFRISDSPDALADSTESYVYFDFCLLCKDTFTFPNVRRGPIYHPPPRYALLDIPGRHGNVTQSMGSGSSWIELGVDLAQPSAASWKRTGDTKAGQVFEDIAFGSVSEPWQWLTTSRWSMKATLEEPRIDYSEGKRLVDLVFREYRGFDAANESHVERWGLNL